MEKEQKCENGPTGVRDLNSQVTSEESPPARDSNRSIRAVVETAPKRPERRQISDQFACSSNPPNYRDEHNSPSPPINEAKLECTKCEPAGVHGTKCGIFQQTGSALLNDCSVSAVGVSQSGFDTLGEVACDSVRTEGSGVARRDGYGFKHVSNPGSLDSQDTFRDNSEYLALFASSGNSETIFRSYVISQDVPSEEVAGCECIPSCGNDELNDLRSCKQTAASAEHLENSFGCQRCSRNCFHIGKTNIRCDCCCPVSSGLSNLAANLHHQTAAVSTKQVCRVHRLCPTAVIKEKHGLTPCEILPSSDSGADSSESASQPCKQAVQCDSTSTKVNKNTICEQNKVSIGFLIPSWEAGGSDYNTTSGSSEKLRESQGSIDSPSSGNTLQKDNRIEVSPAVRRTLIQISKSLQKKQSRVRIVKSKQLGIRKKLMPEVNLLLNLGNINSVTAKKVLAIQ